MPSPLIAIGRRASLDRFESTRGRFDDWGRKHGARCDQPRRSTPVGTAEAAVGG